MSDHRSIENAERLERAICDVCPAIQAVLLRLPAAGFENMKDDLRGILSRLGVALNYPNPAGPSTTAEASGPLSPEASGAGGAGTLQDGQAMNQRVEIGTPHAAIPDGDRGRCKCGEAFAASVHQSGTKVCTCGGTEDCGREVCPFQPLDDVPQVVRECACPGRVVRHLDEMELEAKARGDRWPLLSCDPSDTIDAFYHLIQQIEKCGASPELTDAVVMAGDLRDKLRKSMTKLMGAVAAGAEECELRTVAGTKGGA